MFLVLNAFVPFAQASDDKRLVVLGIDGMDAGLVEAYIEEGILPNLKRLSESGDFKPLGTSVPPQSPVAWSNFTTGMNPGGHGLFDFLAIDRKTLEPYMSSVRTVTDTDLGTIPLGDWQLPLSEARPELLRKGKTFWEILGENGIPSRVFRVPANYPPTGAPDAKVISGMGTPDLKGSPGTFTFFTDDPRFKNEFVSGGEIRRLAVRDGKVLTRLTGPANPFRKGTPDSTAAVTFDLDVANGKVLIDTGAEAQELEQGEWGAWQKVELELVPAAMAVNGMVRFYVQQLEPFVKIYASPINIDPRAAVQPIANPAEYAFELAEHAGPFYTQEMPEDTKALSAHILSPDEYLDQSGVVLDERRALLNYELEQFKKESGDAFMFFYFSSLDLRNHMLDRQQQSDHPYHEADTSDRLKNAMRTTYQEMDVIVGQVLDSVSEETAVAVMSDHGFSQFFWQVNLNSWLEQEGYLKVKDSADRATSSWLDAVDWEQTRAFAIGLNSLYLNVSGRDKHGIVDPADRESLGREIVAKLADWQDASTGQHVVTQPLLREDIYSGPELESAPDILVGYGSGYRSSWATTSGEVPAVIFEPNMEEWSGDHCVDSRLVPGVLLVNRPIIKAQPDLRDLTAAIVAFYGIGLPEQLEGTPAF